MAVHSAAALTVAALVVALLVAVLCEGAQIFAGRNPTQLVSGFLQGRVMSGWSVGSRVCLVLKGEGGRVWELSSGSRVWSCCVRADICGLLCLWTLLCCGVEVWGVCPMAAAQGQRHQSITAN